MKKKTVHVHLHEPTGPMTGRTRDGEGGEGKWVTINGAHVQIGEGGKITKGPAALVGKSEHEAHSHTHAEKGTAHAQAAKDKGAKHPDTKYHEAASREHFHAKMEYGNAHAAAEAGDLKKAKAHHAKAESHAASANEHEKTLATPSAAPKAAAPAKPQKHVALHSEAEDDVKGSEKHEAEHKRLMKLYDGSKADWERTATNRLIQKNQTDAVQHKAQSTHNMALAASEHAKASANPDDHANAIKHIDAAIAAHGRAGGVGYAAKQADLQKARKLHEKQAGKGLTPTQVEAHSDNAKTFRARAQQYRKPAGEGAKPDEKMAGLHDQLADHHEHIVKHPNDDHTERKKAIKDLHSQVDQHQADALKPPASKAAKERAAKATMRSQRLSGAFDAPAIKAVKKAAEEGADQDPDHKE